MTRRQRLKPTDLHAASVRLVAEGLGRVVIPIDVRSRIRFPAAMAAQLRRFGGEFLSVESADGVFRIGPAPRIQRVFFASPSSGNSKMSGHSKRKLPPSAPASVEARGLAREHAHIPAARFQFFGAAGFGVRPRRRAHYFAIDE